MHESVDLTNEWLMVFAPIASLENIGYSYSLMNEISLNDERN
jgi:hypothetical protein